MKKVIAVLIIVLMLLNVYFPVSFSAYKGASGTFSEILEHENENGEENFKDMLEEGEVAITGEKNGEKVTQKRSIKENPSARGLTIKIMGSITSLWGKLFSLIISWSVQGTVFSNEDTTFTIGELLLGKYALFDINIFEEMDANSDKYVGDSDIANIINTSRNQVAIWYYSIRNIAIVSMVLVGIYVGIRMAIATVAEERAKYKKMLIGWVTGLIIIFAMHYIVVILISISNALIGVIKSVFPAEFLTGTIEQEIVNNVWDGLWRTKDWMSAGIYAFTYLMLIYYQLKFFIIYLMRVLKVYFFVIISPLIGVSYAIDYLKDGRAQAWKTFMREFVGQVLLQPIHLLLYIVFMVTAGEIAKEVPIAAVIFLATLGNGEKVIKAVFNFKPKFNRGIKETKVLPI